MMANGPLVRQLREQKGWTQAQLAQKCGSSRRALILWESGGSIRGSKLDALGRALGVLPATQLLSKHSAAIPLREIPRFLLQQVFPEEDSAVLEELRAVALQDMSADFGQAEGNLRSLLDRSPADNLDLKAHMLIRLATVLDNARHSRAAFDLLRGMLEDPQWLKIEGWIRLWLKHHVGVAQRRVAETLLDGGRMSDVADRYLKEAEVLFREVEYTGNEGQRIAATHQLGCICLVRARFSTGRRQQLLSRARKHFEEARSKWAKSGNFREGYAHERLAEWEWIHHNRRAAFACLLNALEIYSRHGCTRYVERVRARFETWLSGE